MYRTMRAINKSKGPCNESYSKKKIRAVHAIGDFDYDKAKGLLNLPSEFKIELIIALGKPGDKRLLPAELQAREVVTERKPLEARVFEDAYRRAK